MPFSALTASYSILYVWAMLPLLSIGCRPSASRSTIPSHDPSKRTPSSPSAATNIAEQPPRSDEQHQPNADLNSAANLNHYDGPLDVVLTVPLSGQAQTLGVMAQRGATLAAETAGSNPCGPAALPRIQLSFVDENMDGNMVAEQLIAKLTEHTANRNAVVIIGGLTNVRGAAIGRQAEQWAVPLIALNASPEATTWGATTFRQFPTPYREAKLLIDTAMHHGDRTFTVFYPNTRIGASMHTQLTQHLHLTKAVLRSLPPYPNDNTIADFAKTFARARVDAVYWAGSRGDLLIAVPTLAAVGWWSSPWGQSASEQTHRYRLLIPHLAWSDSLLSSMHRYLQGAVVALPFNPRSTDTQSQEFVLSFESRFDLAPDMLAAFAYDATLLAAAGVAATRSSNLSLDHALSGLANCQTVTSSRGFNSNRDTRNPADLYIVQDNALAPL